MLHRQRGMLRRAFSNLRNITSQSISLTEWIRRQRGMLHRDFVCLWRNKHLANAELFIAIVVKYSVILVLWYYWWDGYITSAELFIACPICN